MLKENHCSPLKRLFLSAAASSLLTLSPFDKNAFFLSKVPQSVWLEYSSSPQSKGIAINLYALSPITGSPDSALTIS